MSRYPRNSQNNNEFESDSESDHDTYRHSNDAQVGYHQDEHTPYPNYVRHPEPYSYPGPLIGYASSSYGPPREHGQGNGRIPGYGPAPTRDPGRGRRRPDPRHEQHQVDALNAPHPYQGASAYPPAYPTHPVDESHQRENPRVFTNNRGNTRDMAQQDFTFDNRDLRRPQRAQPRMDAQRTSHRDRHEPRHSYETTYQNDEREPRQRNFNHARDNSSQMHRDQYPAAIPDADYDPDPYRTVVNDGFRGPSTSLRQSPHAGYMDPDLRMQSNGYSHTYHPLGYGPMNPGDQHEGDLVTDGLQDLSITSQSGRANLQGPTVNTSRRPQAPRRTYEQDHDEYQLQNREGGWQTVSHNTDYSNFLGHLIKRSVLIELGFADRVDVQTTHRQVTTTGNGNTVGAVSLNCRVFDGDNYTERKMCFHIFDNDEVTYDIIISGQGEDGTGQDDVLMVLKGRKPTKKDKSETDRKEKARKKEREENKKNLEQERERERRRSDWSQ